MELADVDAFGDGGRTSDGDGSIGVGLFNRKWALFSFKFLSAVREDENRHAWLDVKGQAALVLLEVVSLGFGNLSIENVLPICKISCRDNHVAPKNNLTWCAVERCIEGGAQRPGN